MDTSELTVVREEPAPCRVKLDVEISQKAVGDVYRKVERAVRKQAKIPGFRAEKAPRSLLRSHYGSQIDDQAKQELLREGMPAALEKEDIKPETVPQVENEADLTARENSSFVFAMTFDVAPDFELPEYKGLHLEQAATDIADEQVENVVDDLLRERTSYEKVDRAGREGDLLKVSYQGKLDEGDGEEELSETAKYLLNASETWLPLHDPPLIPGAADVLAGAEAGETREADITFPEDFHEDSLAGKDAHYKFDVIEILEAKVPELTDDVAQQFGLESADQARGRIREHLQASEENRAQQKLESDLTERLMEQVDFKVPPGLHARETYRLTYRLAEQAMQQGATQDDIQQRVEELRKQASEMATHSLKRHYILRRIAHEEGIQVEPEQVNDAVSSLAERKDVSEREMIKRLRDNDSLSDLIDSLLENNVIAKLIEWADIAEPASTSSEDDEAETADAEASENKE